MRLTIRRRITVVGVLLLILLVGGTAGYRLIEGWSLFDALYQTVFTVSTVGFSELHPMSTAGRAFTMVLILAGVGSALYALGTAVQIAVEGELGEIFGRRRMHQRIAALRGHYIICGFGRVGREIARELHERRVPFVVIDNSGGEQATPRHIDYDYVDGNATDDAVLIEAGVTRASGLLAASDSDTDNTFIVLTARALNPSLYIVARAGQAGSEPKLLRAGADRVISPYTIAGQHMALTALQPAMVDFMSAAFHSQDNELIVAELHVTPASGLAGHTLDDLFSQRHTTTVLGLRRVTGQVLAGPPGPTVLEEGDQLFVLGSPAELESFAVCGGAALPVRPAAATRSRRLIPPLRRSGSAPRSLP